MKLYFPSNAPIRRDYIHKQHPDRTSDTCPTELAKCSADNESLKTDLANTQAKLLTAQLQLKRATSAAKIIEIILQQLRNVFSTPAEARAIVDSLLRMHSDTSDLDPSRIDFDAMIQTNVNNVNDAMVKLNVIHSEEVVRASQILQNCQRDLDILKSKPVVVCPTPHIDKMEARARGLWAVLKELRDQISDQPATEALKAELYAIIKRDESLSEVDQKFLDMLTNNIVHFIHDWSTPVIPPPLPDSPIGPTSPEGPDTVTGPITPEGPEITGPITPEGPEITGPITPEGPFDYWNPKNTTPYKINAMMQAIEVYHIVHRLKSTRNGDMTVGQINGYKNKFASKAKVPLKLVDSAFDYLHMANRSDRDAWFHMKNQRHWKTRAS